MRNEITEGAQVSGDRRVLLHSLEPRFLLNFLFSLFLSFSGTLKSLSVLELTYVSTLNRRGAAGGLPAHEGPPRRGGRPRGQEEGEEVVHGRSIKGECAREGLESLVVPPLRDPPCVDESWQSKEIILFIYILLLLASIQKKVKK